MLLVVREGELCLRFCCPPSVTDCTRMNMYVEVVVINLLIASSVMVNLAEDDTGKTGERSH